MSNMEELNEWTKITLIILTAAEFPPKNCSPLLHWHIKNESDCTWTLSKSQDFPFFLLDNVFESIDALHVLGNRLAFCFGVFWGRGKLERKDLIQNLEMILSLK